jgi:hypothetical protein
MISVGVDDMTGILSMSVSTPWKQFSEQVAARTLAEVVRFDMEKRQTRAAAERRFSETRLDSARSELRRAEDRLGVFIQHNRQYATSPALSLEFNRLQRQVAVRHEVFTSLTQSFERARIEEVRNTPVVTIIEAPEGSATRDSRNGVRSVIVGFTFGSMVALVVAALLEFGRRARTSDRAEYREFIRLRRQAIQRLMPWRRFGTPTPEETGLAAGARHAREPGA